MAKPLRRKHVQTAPARVTRRPRPRTERRDGRRDDLPGRPRDKSHGDLHDNLIDSVLDVVPVQNVLDAVVRHVRKANDADQMLSAISLRGERAKPSIQLRSGPAWSTEEVARRLEKTAQTVRNDIAAHKLIGYRALNDGTRLELPVWQFQHDRRATTVHPWVPELLQAFGTNGWALIDFVTVPRTHLSGGHYLASLLGGQVAEVIAAAKRANPT